MMFLIIPHISIVSIVHRLSSTYYIHQRFVTNRIETLYVTIPSGCRNRRLSSRCEGRVHKDIPLRID